MKYGGLRVKLQRLTPAARKPKKGPEGAAYYDLYAAQDAKVYPGRTRAVTTGWNIEVPFGWFLDIRPRSGMALKGVTVNNAPGTVDADFRGELMIILHNHSSDDWDVKVGDRIAQCALMPVVECDFVIRGKLSQTKRGTGGYGSTGK
jgi:dUTP pyrophosphatase